MRYHCDCGETGLSEPTVATLGLWRKYCVTGNLFLVGLLSHRGQALSFWGLFYHHRGKVYLARHQDKAKKDMERDWFKNWNLDAAMPEANIHSMSQ